LGRFVG